MLETGDGNQIYWEERGNPAGVPVLIVHGGPGSGCGAGAGRSMDQQRFRVIAFDQRNCGRSTPHASDPAADMTLNTTQRLVSDMEQLRQHLGVGKYLLCGSSWGSTLSLAYGEQYPAHVSGMRLTSVTSTRKAELDWLYRGGGLFYPEAWERFRDYVGAAQYRSPLDAEPPIGVLLAAYSARLEDPDPQTRLGAARAWLAWEDTLISGETNGSPGAYSDRLDHEQVAFVRICAHYFSHYGFLDDGTLIRDAGKLAGIPAVLIHGRGDISGPAITAWDLARAWPGSELIVIEDSGHTGSTTMRQAGIAALDRLYSAITS
jgi:proline iminopeptidase